MAVRELKDRKRLAEARLVLYRQLLELLQDGADGQAHNDFLTTDQQESAGPPGCTAEVNRTGRPPSPGGGAGEEERDLSDCVDSSSITVTHPHAAASPVLRPLSPMRPPARPGPKGHSGNASTGARVWGMIEDTVSWIAHAREPSEEARLAEEILKVKRQRDKVRASRAALSARRRDMLGCRGALLQRACGLERGASEARDTAESCRAQRLTLERRTERLAGTNAVNDCFHIWHHEHFGTINGFRVGRLPEVAARPGRPAQPLVEWAEINAGIGQAVMALSVVAQSMQLRFSKFYFCNLGSFTKVARKSDGRILYPLHTDDSISLFGGRRDFNRGLQALLHCLKEAGTHAELKDPTLQVPHAIGEGTIGGLPIVLGSSLEEWTRAMKFLLTDLKWTIAWAAKYASMAESAPRHAP